jgi:hypothetical protein
MKRTSSVLSLLVAMVLSFVAVPPADAAITLSAIDTADFMTVAAAVVAFLGILYGVKRALGLLR